MKALHTMNKIRDSSVKILNNLVNMKNRYSSHLKCTKKCHVHSLSALTVIFGFLVERNQNQVSLTCFKILSLMYM